MHPRFPAPLVAFALMILLAASPAATLTFTVDSLADLTDLTPGDGICFNSRPPFFLPECTLRAAIEEANASPGTDTIEFSSGLVPNGQGALVIAPGSALPPIGESVVIDGTTAPTYQTWNPDALPIVHLDGSSAGMSSGLTFSPNPAGSTILGIGIVDFSGHGLLLSDNEFGGVENLVVEGTHIGVFRGTTPAGNGGAGISGAQAHGAVIGASCNIFSGCSGRGNVISANGSDGIALGGDGITVAGNRIGTIALGNSITGFGNGGFGIELVGNSNRIGDQGESFGNPEAAGNLVSGNTLGGIWVRGDQNEVYANLVGTDVTGTLAMGNSGLAGIQVDGNVNTIGDGDVGANLVGGNDGAGIRIGFSTSVPANSNAVEGNWVGTNDQGHDLGNGGVGIAVLGSFNLLGAFGGTAPNTVGFNAGGIAISGDDNAVRANYIGTDDQGNDRGNDLFGVRVTDFADDTNIGGAQQTTDPTLPALANEIAFNAGPGVVVDAFTTLASVRGNAIHDNAAAGIDLDFDGPTANDIGALDSGPNDLQNFPEFDPLQTAYDGGAGQVDVRYRVDSFVSWSDYPLKIDFYVADAAGLGGETWMASDVYDAVDASLFRSISFPAPSGVGPTSSLVATATSFARSGASSEFSPPILLPEPGPASGLTAGLLLLSWLARRRAPRAIESNPGEESGLRSACASPSTNTSWTTPPASCGVAAISWPSATRPSRFSSTSCVIASGWYPAPSCTSCSGRELRSATPPWARWCGRHVVRSVTTGRCSSASATCAATATAS